MRIIDSAASLLVVAAAAVECAKPPAPSPMPRDPCAAGSAGTDSPDSAHAVGPAHAPAWTWSNPRLPSNGLNALWGDDAGLLIAAGDGGQILRSTDAGASWTSIPSGVESSLLAASGQGSVVYAVGAEGVILRSDDAGRTFYRIASGTQLELTSLAVQSRYVYIAGKAPDGPTEGVLLVSRDGGHAFDAKLFPTERAAGIAVEAGLVALALTGDSRSRVLRSFDGGRTFSMAWSRERVLLSSLVGSGTGRLYASGATLGDVPLPSPPGHPRDYLHDALTGGVFLRSTDRGATWRDRPFEAEFDVQLQARGDTVVATPYELSHDGGRTWQSLLEAPRMLPSAYRGMWIGADGRLVLAGWGGRIAISDDRGATFNEISPSTHENFYGIWATTADEVYVAGASGLWRSRDGGSTLERLGGAHYDAPWASVWGSAPRDLFVATAPGYGVAPSGPALLHSADGGATFTRVEMPRDPDGRSMSPLRVWGTRRDDIYVACRHGLVLRSHDAGASFLVSSTGTLADLYDLWGEGEDLYVVGGQGTILYSPDRGATWLRQGDADVPPHGAACTSIWGSGAHDIYVACGVLLRSRDGGAHWDSLPSAPANAMLVSGAGPAAVYVVAGDGSHAYGVYLTTDQGASFVSAPTGMAAPPRSVLAASPGAIYVVGDLGTMLRGR
jgi:photosystem II stability/assembly factor-like uncharacterized protein